MLVEDHFSRFLSLWLTLVLDDFIILGQLNLVGFDHLCNFRFAGLLETGQHLNEVDRHLKDVLGGRYDLFILFGIVFKIFS